MLKKFLALGTGILLLILVWYLWSPAVCLTPITYSLNRLDSEFLITDDEVEKAFMQAEKLWEDEVGYNLFTYKKDGSGKIKIDFIFDDRQSSANSALVQKKTLDKQKDNIDSIQQTISGLTDEYQKLFKSYKRALSSYNQELSTYNNDVKIYNDIGGAPEDIFLKLEKKRKNLKTQADNLTSTVDRLNFLSKNINQSEKKLNVISKEYNLKVETYNNRFGTHKEFTQGDYVTNRINIYKFSSPYELSIVLAHEFGHALGLKHVNAKDSIMYYIFDKNKDVSKPSADDKKMFFSTCNDNSNLRIILNKIFKKLKIS